MRAKSDESDMAIPFQVEAESDLPDVREVMQGIRTPMVSSSFL
jgi:hypothetical protein